MKTKKQIVALIQETIDFYSIFSNLSTKNDGVCCYLNVDNGNKCAVGRCLSESALEIVSKEELDAKSSFGFHVVEALTDGNTFKEEYQGFDEVIWSKLQNIHDHCDNWEEPYGISSYGISEVHRKFPEYAGLFVFNKPMTENPYYKSDV